MRVQNDIPKVTDIKRSLEGKMKASDSVSGALSTTPYSWSVFSSFIEI